MTGTTSSVDLTTARTAFPPSGRVHVGVAIIQYVPVPAVRQRLSFLSNPSAPPPLFEPNPHTSATHPRPVGPDVGVRLVIGVPIGAMSLARVPRGNRHAPKRIDASGDRLEVRRIHAGAHAAKMIQVQPEWNGANEQLVADAMSEPRDALFGAATTEDSVPTTIAPRRPHPAPSADVVDSDLFEEAVDEGARRWRHANILRSDRGVNQESIARLA